MFLFRALPSFPSFLMLWGLMLWGLFGRSISTTSRRSLASFRGFGFWGGGWVFFEFELEVGEDRVQVEGFVLVWVSG